MEPDLASLLTAGERAVFHGRPASAVDDLERAVAVATADGRRAEATAAAWLLGVALSASGRYGGALRVLLPLLVTGEAAAAGAESKLFGALAAATAASVHRGLGRHPAAAELDSRGLALTDGTGEAAFDCVLGLASDAVGAGDLSAARERLGAAEALADARGGEWWRQRIRLQWAQAEIELLAERPQHASQTAAAAVARAEASRAPRHVAKGLLFQGVAELQSGDDEATATLRRAAALADGLGVLPVVWQARALLGAVLPATDGAERTRSFAAARSAVLSIAADLSQELREEWLGRPNVTALLEG